MFSIFKCDLNQGRKQGGLITDIVIKALNKNGKNIEDRYNYKTTTKDGSSIKSSTIFIRNSAGDVIGAFYTNIDTTDLLTTGQVPPVTGQKPHFQGPGAARNFCRTIG